MADIIKKEEPDVEAPKTTKVEEEEDPSVVLTADDDSSVGTSDEAAATATTGSSRRSLSSWKVYGSLFVVMGIAVVVAVLAITCPGSKNSSDRVNSLSMQDLLGDLEDTPYYGGGGGGNRPPCNKTKDHGTTGTGSDVQEEDVSKEGEEDLLLVDDFPKKLPFENVPPIKSFTPDVLNGYSSVEELQNDLTIATKHMLNRIILQNVYNDFLYTHGKRPAESSSVSNRPLRPAAATASEETSSVAQAAGATASAASASKTNNQEDGADEADHVKNDDNYVYASYGDYLVVWDKQGTQITTVHMATTPHAGSGGFPATNQDGTRNAWTPPTYINGLLLTPTKVVVLVDGYSTTNNENGEFLHSNQATQIRMYSKPSPQKLKMELLESHNVNGMYRDGRYMENSQTIQLLTTGDINAYSHLIAPLQMYRFTGSGSGSSSHTNSPSPQDYMEAATELATTKLIPEFVEGVSRALMINDKLPNLIRVNDWSNNNVKNTKQDSPKSVEDILRTIEDGLSNYYTADAPMKAFLQVVSIQTEGAEEEQQQEETTKLSSSVVLVPSTETQFYASSGNGDDDHDDDVLVAVTHSQYDDTTLHTKEDLFLLHMKSAADDDDEGLLTFHSVATLPGHINSAYSLDIQGNDLRIATTQQLWTPLDRVWPLCGGENGDWLVDPLSGGGDGDEEANDSCRNDDTFAQCVELAINGCQNIEKSGCPYQYTCTDDEEAASSTENHVIVFDISQPGEMKEVGRVQIGEPHEIITAVRFGETFSYAMTFDQRDPFYVLRLEPGQPPVISGSLKLDGFSRYLHPLNPQGTLLVGIGQNVTGTGLEQRDSGVMLTVFDVSDPAQPVVVASHQLENEDKVDSFTHAEWDAKAVQYTNGKLVLPVSLYHHLWDEVGDDETWFNGNNIDDFVSEEEEEEDAVSPKTQDEKENFDGFIVYTIGDTGIQEAFRINFLPTEENCHYCSGGMLTSRSIIFDDGSLMTMHGDSVQSNNLYTGNTHWKMNVTLAGVSKNCCW